MTKKELQKVIAEKDSRIFDLDRDVFEAQQFGKIAEDKLTVWVKRHDVLLLAYKELLKNNEQSSKKHGKKIKGKSSKK